MSNEIVKVFENEEFGTVRTILIDNKPWFVGRDVCEMFGDTNYRRSLSRLDDDERVCHKVNTLGGKQNMTLINESGLYSLLFFMQPQKAKGVSQNDKAINERIEKLKRFKRWVTSEVLPTIRKTGSYSIQPKQDSYMIEDPVKRAERWIEEYKERMALEEKIEADKPKVEFANHVADTSDLIDIGTLAKLANDENIPIGRNRLFEWLRSNGILMNKGIHKNEPYQKCIDNGWFAVKEYSYKTPYGNQIGTKTYVTGKGQMYIIEKLREEKF